MILKVLLPVLFVHIVSGIYQPGDSGAPWTVEEIDIVRDKVFFQAFCFLLLQNDTMPELQRSLANL